MANPKVTLSSVVKKLDLLDGVEDRHYTNWPLLGENSTGVCGFKEDLIAAGPLPKNIKIGARLHAVDGRTVIVDCQELVRKLNTLIGIAQKIPATRFKNRLATCKARKRCKQIKKEIKSGKVPTAEELFGYHIVDHIISALLLGIMTTDESFGQMFSEVAWCPYNTSVHTFGQLLNKPDFANFNIRTTDEAYKLFERLGKKHGFDTRPFKPLPAEKPPAKKLPAEKQPEFKPKVEEQKVEKEGLNKGE